MNKKLQVVLFLSLFVLYLLGGIAIFCYEYLYDDKTYIGYGLLVFAGSLVHIILYFLNQGYKNKRCSYLLVLGILGAIIGILFLTTNISFRAVCLLWGILDIARGASEILFTIPLIKNKKIEIYDIAISIMDIIFGILLCVKLADGLHIHIIILGISFILSAFKYPLMLLIGKNRKV